MFCFLNNSFAVFIFSVFDYLGGFCLKCLFLLFIFKDFNFLGWSLGIRILSKIFMSSNDSVFILLKFVRSEGINNIWENKGV